MPAWDFEDPLVLKEKLRKNIEQKQAGQRLALATDMVRVQENEGLGGRTRSSVLAS